MVTTIQVQRELAAAALAGDGAMGAVAMFVAALRAFVGVRNAVGTMVGSALSGRNMRATYVRIRMPGRGGVADMLLRDSEARERIVRWTLRTRKEKTTVLFSQDVVSCGERFAEQTSQNVDATLLALRGIERARKRLFVLAEEGSRWT